VVTAGTILLIEDNADDELLTIRALKRNNLLNEVRVAHDGAEALELLFPVVGEDPPYPELILLDLKLPKVDGIEVLQRIRGHDRTRNIPVVILTASREQEDIIAGYANGANAYVRKPVRFGEFAEAVKILGMFWLLVNQPPPRF
jgi:two-component system response regulator